MGSAVLDIQNLSRRYGSRRGVEAVNLSIPEGSLYGFLGPNGAGKTTTIRVLLGFLRPTSGAARVFGLDCWRESARIKAEVGYVPGDLRLPGWLTGETALRLFGKVRRRDLWRRGMELAGQFELDMRVAVRRMSRGMRQKLGLILAMAHAPRLLVMDEPTASLDPLMQDRLHDELRRAAREGRTVFFSSHTLSEVERLCDRVAIVKDGRIVADETLESLKRRAGHEVEVVWREGTTPPLPPELAGELKAEGRVWRGVVGGDMGPLLAFLGGKPVEDVTIAKPDLEALFRRYYGQEHGS